MAKKQEPTYTESQLEEQTDHAFSAGFLSGATAMVFLMIIIVFFLSL